MPARRQSTANRLPALQSDRFDEEAIQSYLHLTDDGETARLAAMMVPESETFDPLALIDQAEALQAAAAGQLVRRREEMVKSMSRATLVELAGRLGQSELDFLGFIDVENLPDHPILGPVLRRLATLIRDLPPPQDFPDLFLAENPTDALDRASNRTALCRPLPSAPFEELLRFAANIPEDVISWDILNGAFIDFLRIWFQDRLQLAELVQGGPDAGPRKSKASSVMDRIEKLQRKRTRFYESFKPGHEFPPDIVELARRAYTECWEGGMLGPQWRPRFAWLADEFPPFWQRFGDAYYAIHQARVKTEAESEAARMKAVAEAEAQNKREQNMKSSKARESGRTGLQSREGKRLKKATEGFIEFLSDERKIPEGAALSAWVDAFVEGSPILGKKQDRANTRKFLGALCAAFTEDKNADYVMKTYQHPLDASPISDKPNAHTRFLRKMTDSQRGEFETKGVIPDKFLEHKSVTVEAVDDCLEALKRALSNAPAQKNKKRLDGGMRGSAPARASRS